MGQSSTRLPSDLTERSPSVWTLGKLLSGLGGISTRKPSPSRERRSKSRLPSDRPSEWNGEHPGSKKASPSKENRSNRHRYPRRRSTSASVDGLYVNQRNHRNSRSRPKRRHPDTSSPHANRKRRSYSSPRRSKPKASNSAAARRGHTPGTTRPSRNTTGKTKAKSKSKIQPQRTSTRRVDTRNVSRREASAQQDCIVCVETRSVRHFPNRPPTSSCTHTTQVCKRCLRDWIRSEFKAKVWNQINCPECRSLMLHEDIREFAPPEVFRKYDSLATKAAFEAIPGFRWCTAKGCKSGQVHGAGPEQPIFKCVGCGFRYCVVHNRRWHKGETCAEYDYRTDGTQRRAEEMASEKLIKGTTKKCPGCKWNIEKNYGCDHMTCSKCRHEFCWICLAPYRPIRENGNSMHRTDCTYYR
ncbi:hypothetical protein K432DRAFT_426286 [Lepidopterella palustris CBS 459.81]|uniref:RBR-type E3 ubiquitin transferase n=1 Tax=Lepidopterella palustris CBS 459.81 TaxID=1314670 RepID=A0A8E2E9Y9_9PEZI|nr:hypothetical protein K432DRAFT_426286 [Lepidopterella palustris CBS 459.81]